MVVQDERDLEVRAIMQEQTKRKAYSYIRFSSKKQEQGDSVRRQSEATNRYLALHPDLELDRQLTFEDLGTSAFKGKHKVGQLGAFLKACQEGFVPPGSVLLVEALDRISREDAIDALDTLKDIMREGISVVTVSDGKEYSMQQMRENPFDLMMALLMFVRANEESRVKSQRVAAAWAGKRARVKDGHQLTSRVPFWINPENKNEVIPERVKDVELIFDLALQGLGAGKICIHLNSLGIAPPSAGRRTKAPAGWGLSTLHKVVWGRQVLGEVLLNKTRWEKGYYPQIISEDLYNQVRRLMTSKTSLYQNKSLDKEGKPVVNHLTGICKCKACGGSCSNKQDRNRDGSTYYSIRCSASITKQGSCRHHQITHHKILSAITDFLVVFGEDFSDQVQKPSIDLAQEIEELTEQKNIVFDLIKKDRKNTEAIEEYEKLTSTISQLRASLGEIQVPYDHTVTVKAIQECLEQGPTNKALKLIFDSIEIDFVKEVLHLHLANQQVYEVPIDRSARFDALTDKTIS